MTCNLCNQACLGCSGPRDYDCLACSSQYNPTVHGTCELKTCTKDEYLDINGDCQGNYIYIYIYIACSPECSACIGPLSTNCRGCQEGLYPKYIDSSQVKCVECEKVRGYLTIREGSTNKKACSEICGDGINLGEYKCDDGNKKDGDGCSSECKLEEGYSCQGGNALNPDVCRDIAPPILALSHNTKKKKLDLKYKFALSKPVQILSSKDPKEFVSVSISGKYPNYELDYEIDFTSATFSGRSMSTVDLYSQIGITLIPLSSIMNNDVIYIYIYNIYIYIFKIETENSV